MTSNTDPGFGRPGGLTPPSTLNGRFGITDVQPAVEAGRRPVKAVENEQLTLQATAFREGHDELGVDALLRGPSGQEQIIAMTRVPEALNRWECSTAFSSSGDWSFIIRAWDDPLSTWRKRAEIKIPAGIDVDLELLEGALLLDRVLAESAELPATDSTHLYAVASQLRDPKIPAEDRLMAATNPETARLLTEHPLRDELCECGPWPIRVERIRALYGSWYEFFPRSEGAKQNPPESGTLRDAQRRLPAVAQMGFDVVYLPPIHPIGEVNRKGRNNTLDPADGDPGSPWAIGSKDGGHTEVHPDLGSVADFDEFVARATGLGLEVALDLALQAAPDHPWD